VESLDELDPLEPSHWSSDSTPIASPLGSPDWSTSPFDNPLDNPFINLFAGPQYPLPPRTADCVVPRKYLREFKDGPFRTPKPPPNSYPPHMLEPMSAKIEDTEAGPSPEFAWGAAAGRLKCAVGPLSMPIVPAVPAKGKCYKYSIAAQREREHGCPVCGKLGERCGCPSSSRQR
jgi:hypothetical protein